MIDFPEFMKNKVNHIDCSQQNTPDISALYREMDEQMTPEAKLYKSLDKLEALIQHNESPLKTWSIISLVVGIVFIAYGLYQDYKAGKKK